MCPTPAHATNGGTSNDLVIKRSESSKLHFMRNDHCSTMLLLLLLLVVCYCCLLSLSLHVFIVISISGAVVLGENRQIDTKTDGQSDRQTTMKIDQRQRELCRLRLLFALNIIMEIMGQPSWLNGVASAISGWLIRPHGVVASCFL